MRKSWISLATLALLTPFVACSDNSGDGKGGGGFSSGAELNISVTPNPISFATVSVGGHGERLVTISHIGTSGTLRLRSVTLQPEATRLAGEIAITQPLESALEAGGSTTLLVTYDPTDSKRDSGELVIETNIATQSGETLTLHIPIETGGQASTLIAVPNPVDFGKVGTGESAPRTVQITNPGADTVIVTALDIAEGSAFTDFDLVSPPTLPLEVGPGANFSLDVLYTPTGGGADGEFLTITATIGSSSQQFDILLRGEEVGPKMTLFPDPVDFGWRAIGETHKLPLNIANDGTRPLVITTLELASWSHESVNVQGLPTLPFTIAPEDPPLSLEVTFTPTPDLPLTGAPLGAVNIESNNPAEDGFTAVSIYGRAESPVLQVNPPELLEFGFVAQQNSRTRKLNLFNAGSAPLEVTGIDLTETDTNSNVEFVLVTDGSWGPTSAVPTAGTLAPGEGRVVQITFTNLGADVGTEWGEVVIHSNFPAQPDWAVQLKAQRTGAPDCEIRIVPSQLDFGIVPRGFTKTLSAQVEVIGSGNCSYHSSFVNDCSGGFFGAACPDPATTVKQNGDSELYSVGGYSWGPPLATPENLKAGEIYQIEITFRPPDTAPLFGDEFVDYAGFFGVRVFDPYGATPTVPEVYPAKATGGATAFAANLHARSGIADLSVFPNDLDFGLTTIGCHSQTLTVNAFNVGTAPLDLTGWKLQGCSVEFKVKDSPGVPTTLNPGEGVTWDIVYAPQDEGGDACQLEITSNDADSPSAVVPLAGAGTFETHQVDEYTQLTGQDVDVLFVIDNSGSMGEEQSNLGNNFSKFIGEAATWNNDYHLAVTTTDIDSEGGRFVGTPRVMTKATVGGFAAAVKVGTNGSGTEQGLLAAQLALSLPNTSDTSIACTKDADCVSPDGCYDGFCGGPNRGFLRQDASLEIVMVSDEEDQSPADLNFYLNFFKSIKGFFNDNLLHIHAIVGPPGGCSSSNGDAGAGLRYRDIAQSTGGNVASICESNFATALKSIGEIAFGLKVQFFLSRPADPATISVSVNGVNCPNGAGANWSYNEPSNSIVFVETGGCMPQPGEKIVFEYDTICFLE
ncbi:MAG: choice-of-anchor D domain-containing protein [Deltaproteobacteria bacterium]|nr:choice-of-anchor D domain-containing protein [Deltaproteobacteria bacterium]MCB9785860.1 choice-of-anchor D domain-containing protein [Deltaproteobacteria bacterium]